MKFINLISVLVAIKSIPGMRATGAYAFHNPTALSNDAPTQRIITGLRKTTPKHELMHQAVAEVLRLKAAGWTQQDFAAALKWELEIPLPSKQR